MKFVIINVGYYNINEISKWITKINLIYFKQVDNIFSLFKTNSWIIFSWFVVNVHDTVNFKDSKWN
jgi:hypothetical protein